MSENFELDKEPTEIERHQEGEGPEVKRGISIVDVFHQ
jgi:hypothetical protein